MSYRFADSYAERCPINSAKVTELTTNKKAHFHFRETKLCSHLQEIFGMIYNKILIVDYLGDDDIRGRREFPFLHHIIFSSKYVLFLHLRGNSNKDVVIQEGRKREVFPICCVRQIQSVSLHFRVESMARPQAM